MAYLATAYSDPNINIYASANTICDETVDADNFQMVVCTVTLTGLHTDASTISISTYVDGKLLNGYAAQRIKASGATSVHYQLDPIFVDANDKLRIDVQSSNANDTNINATGMIYKTQQANVRLWNDADVADLTDLATSAEITALESHGDTTWATATGFSTHSAADVKTAIEAAGSSIEGIKAKTDYLPSVAAGANGGLPTVDGSNYVAGIAGTKNTLDDLNDVDADTVNAQCDTAISDASLATTTMVSNLQTHGDSTWATATGFSTHTAADVKTAMEAAGSKLDHIHATTEADGESRKFTEAALADAPGSDVTAEAIKTAMEADGSKLDHIWETTEDDGSGTRKFTEDSLRDAPSGTAELAPVDGIAAADALKIMLSVLSGKATRSGNSITFLARDGNTETITVTVGTDPGERTASVVP